MAIGKTSSTKMPLRMAESDRHSGSSSKQRQHARTHSLLWLTHHGVAHMGSIAPQAQAHAHTHGHAHSHASLARGPVKLLIKNGLSREAAELKQRIKATCPDTVFRFSFSSMKRVVTPPVSIPPHLAGARVKTTVVAGKHIPMTKAMWEKSKRTLQRRLPDRIDEQCWY